jgi:hypothetical protein
MNALHILLWRSFSARWWTFTAKIVFNDKDNPIYPGRLIDITLQCGGATTCISDDSYKGQCQFNAFCADLSTLQCSFEPFFCAKRNMNCVGTLSRWSNSSCRSDSGRSVSQWHAILARWGGGSSIRKLQITRHCLDFCKICAPLKYRLLAVQRYGYFAVIQKQSKKTFNQVNVEFEIIYVTNDTETSDKVWERKSKRNDNGHFPVPTIRVVGRQGLVLVP